MIGIIGRILKLSYEHRGRLILSFVAGFLESSIPAFFVFLIFISFRLVLGGEFKISHIILISSLLAASIPLRFVFKLLEYTLQSGTGYEIMCEKRHQLGEKLLHLPMDFYNHTDVGELSSVINNDLVFVEGMAMTYVSKTIGAIVSTVIVMTALFVLDSRIATAALIAFPSALLVNETIQRIWIKCGKERQSTHAETSSVMLEYLQGIYVIKAFGFAGKQKQRLVDVLKRLEIVSYNFEMKGMPFIALYFIILNLFTMLILLLTAVFITDGTIPPETATVIVTMIFAIYTPMEILEVSSGILRLMNTCLDRMQNVMDSAVMDEDGQEIIPSTFDVRFSDVCFSYGDKPVLSDVSFHAPEKTLTAIVGPSGSGKSTILNLIARFWDVGSGSIEIGGFDVRNMKCDSVIRQISAVFQKAYLFHDTIHANIKFGNPDASHDQVIEAAKKSHCHEFIVQMENGYDSVVGEGGCTLSGGERQRITIARALLKDAPIVLLDEVTANIDPENERLIQQAVNALVQEKTVFVVAHKLAAVRNADQILVLGSDGTIQEKGRHQELIKQNGQYAKLWLKSEKVSRWTI